MAAILLVDDDAPLRLNIERALVAGGHAVTSASNGALALKFLDAMPIELVITDVVMPDVDGLQLLREIRARKLAVKVVAISGGGRGAATDYLALATAFGAAATLMKPFTREQLLTVVDRVLTGSLT